MNLAKRTTATFGSLASLTMILLVMVGCSIQKAPNTGSAPEGSLHVTATDSAGQAIVGANILIDGARRPEVTPAYVHGVPAGEHSVILRRFGYWNDTAAVTVVAADTTDLFTTLRYVPAGQTGWLKVESSPSLAEVLLDSKAHTDSSGAVMTPATIRLAWGSYHVSAHRDGYATMQPILPELQIDPGETTAVAFTLDSVQVAQIAGALPFNFRLETVDGDSIALGELTGNVVLLNFWYINCVPCINEFPGINNVYERHSGDGFRVIAVDPMFPDRRDGVLQLREQLHITFDLLLDWNQHVSAQLYNVNPFPRNILIDRRGIIHSVHNSVTEAELEELVTGLLAASGN